MAIGLARPNSCQASLARPSTSAIGDIKSLLSSIQQVSTCDEARTTTDPWGGDHWLPAQPRRSHACLPLRLDDDLESLPGDQNPERLVGLVDREPVAHERR